MLVRNWDQVLRIGLLPMIILAVAAPGLLSIGGYSVVAISDETAIEAMLQSGLGSVLFALVMVIYLAGSLWIIVSWHRFVLLEEYPQGWLPTFRFIRVLAYVGRALQLGLVMACLMVPIILVFVVVTEVFGQVGASAILMPVLMLVFSMVIVMVFYRLLPLLPAAAVGAPLMLAEAWLATKGASGTFIIVAILGTIFGTALNMLNMTSILLVGSSPLLLWSVSHITGFLITFFNASLMTTIYGHFIEARALD